MNRVEKLWQKQKLLITKLLPFIIMLSKFVCRWERVKSLFSIQNLCWGYLNKLSERKTRNYSTLNSNFSNSHIHLGKSMVNLYKWKHNYWKSWKYCGKSWNCLFWVISLLSQCFKKLSPAMASESLYLTERVNRRTYKQANLSTYLTLFI